MLRERQDEGFVPPRSGSFRVIEARVPEPGRDFPRTRCELDEMFPDENACRDYLERLRWPNGFVCPRCEAHDDPWRSGSGLMICGKCSFLIAVTHGSIFHGSCTPLRTWFRAIWEVTTQKSGVGATCLQRVMGLRDPKAAELCITKLRRTMALALHGRLSGAVEVARSYVEVPQTSVFGRTSLQKAVVAIAMERGRGETGRARIRRLDRVRPRHVTRFVHNVVDSGSEVFTAPWNGYGKLAQQGFMHRVCTHPLMEDIGQVVMPDVQQVASLLNVWLWSTEGVTYENLDDHLVEFCFRFNRRSYPRGLLFYRMMILASYEASKRREETTARRAG